MLSRLAELISGPEGRLEASELAPLVVVLAIVAGGLSLHAQAVAGRPAGVTKKEDEQA